MTEMNIVDAVRTTLAYEMARDERVMVMGEDVDALGGGCFARLQDSSRGSALTG
jgi:pyruvate/2-oxoglutarate/acetoin dehydrogenase E1 component